MSYVLFVTSITGHSDISHYGCGVPRQLGDLEDAVMSRVWQWNRPVTVREVLEDLQQERSIAYTTVMTVMDNLHQKGWVRREVDGRAYRYTAVSTRAAYAAALMNEAWSKSDNPAAALVAFFGMMSMRRSAKPWRTPSVSCGATGRKSPAKPPRGRCRKFRLKPRQKQPPKYRPKSRTMCPPKSRPRAPTESIRRGDSVQSCPLTFRKPWRMPSASGGPGRAMCPRSAVSSTRT